MVNSTGAYISYNIEIIGQESDEHQNAIKFTLFSTGKSISTKEALLIFEEGYRISEENTKGGSGHGLYFVNEIVHIQGGYAGCTPREEGNEFYIVLPKTRNKFETEKETEP